MLHDYREYEYEYIHLLPAGKVVIPMTEYDWTSDPEDEDLTGETRICHHMFYAYKIVRATDGHLYTKKSPLVDNLLEIRDEYPYITEDFIEKVYYEDTKTDKNKPKQYKKKN